MIAHIESIFILNLSKGWSISWNSVRILLTFVMLTNLYTTLFPNFYPVNLENSICKHVFSTIVENSVDPDMVALSEAS